MEFIKAIEAWEIGTVQRGSYVISQLIDLGVTGARSNRRAYKDMARAFAQIAISFLDLEVFSPTEFLSDEEAGAKFRESLLLYPHKRAGTPKRYRKSNLERPYESFKEWFAIDRARGDTATKFPLKWDAIVRPVIARHYREGVLAPAYQTPNEVEGQAIAAKEDGSDELEFFIFYNLKPLDSVFAHIEHPSKWPKIKAECRAYAAAEPHARFAVIRVYSPQLYYPLMLGQESREQMAFADSIGRKWHWVSFPPDKLC